jgi:hypothetical protein
MKGASQMKTVATEVSDETAEHLQELARLEGKTVAEIAGRAVEEYVRTMRFPGIIFVTGGNGRRKAKLLGGPDVWTVVFTARNHSMDVQETADYLGILLERVRLALAYYAVYPGEIDARLEAMDRPLEELLRQYPFAKVLDLSAEEDAAPA